MRKTKKKPDIPARFASAALCLALCLSMAPSAAFGEMRKDDLVAGETIELRGMSADNAPVIAANYACLVDSDGKVYFERNADAKTKIASITKMMTAVVALEEAPLDLVVKVSERAGATGESTAGLREGDTLTLSDAIVGLMVPSGNDAAVAIAENVGALLVDEARQQGKAVEDADGRPVDLDSDDAAYRAFVARMNERAREIGCNDSRFTNPHGLDFDEWESEDPYSTAHDIARLSAYAMGNETFRETVSSDGGSITVNRAGVPTSLKLNSTDELLGEYDGACGIKTGFTDKAGQCFAGACLRDGRYLFAAVLDSSSAEQRFEDAKALYEWVYASECDYTLANSDQTTTMEAGGFSGEVPVVARASLSAWKDRTVPVTLADPQATVRVSSIFGNVSQDVVIDEIPGGVDAGEVVGRVDFYQNNAVVATQDLVACETVGDPELADVLGASLEKLAGLFTGEDFAAESVVLNRTPLLLPKN